METVRIRDLLVNIPMEELYLLYQSDKTIRQLLDQHETLQILDYLYELDMVQYWRIGSLKFFDLLWLYLYNKYIPEMWGTKYIETELFRAVNTIVYQYKNNGRKINYCIDGQECKAAIYLYDHGFKREIEYQLRKQDDYKEWLKKFQHIIVNHIISKEHFAENNGDVIDQVNIKKHKLWDDYFKDNDNGSYDDSDDDY